MFANVFKPFDTVGVKNDDNRYNLKTFNNHVIQQLRFEDTYLTVEPKNFVHNSDGLFKILRLNIDE